MDDDRSAAARPGIGEDLLAQMGALIERGQRLEQERFELPQQAVGKARVITR